MQQNKSRRIYTASRTVVELLERRQLLSTSIALQGTSGNDNIGVSYNPSTMEYSFSGDTTSPPPVAASDFAGFSVIGGGGTEDLATISIPSGAAVHLLGTGNALATSVLVFAGTTDAWQGQLDLGSNNLIVHGGDLPTLTNQLKSGYNGGGWNGATGITSSAASTDSTHLTALGVISNNDGSNNAILSTFSGETVTASDILVKYTYVGDANLDGQVDGSDYTKIDNGYNADLSGWSNGDFNYDGSVNGSDYTLIDNAFNTQGSPIVNSAPTNIQVSTPNLAEIHIAWSYDENAATGFNIYRSANGGAYILVGNADANSTSYDDASPVLDPSASYTYTVTAIATSGTESPASSPSQAVSPFDPGVNISAEDDTAGGVFNPYKPIDVTFTRTSNDTSDDIEIDYTFSARTGDGQAVPGVDVDTGSPATDLGGGVYAFTLPAGQMSAILSFTPLQGYIHNSDVKELDLGILELRRAAVSGTKNAYTWVYDHVQDWLTQTSIYIVHTDGTGQQLKDTSSIGLIAALTAAKNSGNLITSFTDTGHGDPSYALLDNLDLLKADNGKITANGIDITALMQAALAPNATLNFQACSTAMGNNSFAQKLSVLLPGRTVIGQNAVVQRLGQNTIWSHPRSFKDGAQLP
jgi:hypothetical protein